MVIAREGFIITHRYIDMLLHVYRGETGVRHTVDIEPESSAEQLWAKLALVTGAPEDKLILFCNTVMVHKGQPLHIPSLTAPDKTLFLFDRSSFEAGVIPPDQRAPVIEVQEIPTPPLRSEEELHTSPLEWALKKYENHFLQHLNTATAIKKAVTVRLAFSKVCLEEMGMQSRGIEVALENLNKIHSRASTEYTDFKHTYLSLRDKYQSLLESFESDMQKLGLTRIHKALAASSSAETLLDFVPEERMRKWYRECKQEHEQLIAKITVVDQTAMQVSEGVSKENHRKLEMDFKTLQQKLVQLDSIVAEISLRVQQFETDYRDVLTKKETTELKWSICDRLSDSESAHQQQLVKLKEQESSTKHLMAFIWSSKVELIRLVCERLRDISQLQSGSLDVRKKTALFSEALSTLNNGFSQLIYLRAFPNAYLSSIEEVARRRKYGRKLGLAISKIKENLNRMRKEEFERRKQFLDSHGRYIPKNLIPGLNENIPPLEFTIPSFDNILPEIDDDSLEDDEEEFTMVAPDESKQQARLRELEAQNQKLINELNGIRRSDVGNRGRTRSFNEHEDVYKLRSDLSQSQESVNDYRKRIEALESKLSSTYSQIEHAHLETSQMQKMLEDTERVLKQVQEEKLKESQGFQSLEQKFFETQDRLKMKSDVERRLETKAAELEKTQREVHELQAQLKALSSERAKKEEESSALKEAQKEMSAREAQFKEDLTRLREEVKGLKDLNAQLEKSVSSLQTDKEQAIRRCEEIESTSKKERDSAQQELKQMKSKLDSTTNDYQNQKKRTETELSAQLRISLQEKEKVMDDIKRGQEDASKLQARVKLLEEQLERDKQKIKDLESSAELYRIRAEKIEEEKRQTLNTLAEQQSKASKTDEEKILIIRQLNEKLNKVTQTLSKLEQERKELQQSLKKEHDRAEKSEEEYKVLKTNFDGISGTATEQEENHQKTRDTLRLISEKYADVIKQIDQKDRQIKVQLQKIAYAERLEGDQNQEMQKLIKQHSLLDREAKEAQDRVKALEMTLHGHACHKPHLAVEGFEPNDYIIFLPNANGFYEAYNTKCPNYFLSPQVTENFETEIKQKTPVVGQIVQVEPKTAVGPANPFAVPNGTSYFEVLISKYLP